MITHQFIFRALLIGSCGYALWRGRSDERIVALVCLGATLASRFAFSPLNVRYSGVETGLLVIDLLVLGTFVFVALRWIPVDAKEPDLPLRGRWPSRARCRRPDRAGRSTPPHRPSDGSPDVPASGFPIAGSA